MKILDTLKWKQGFTVFFVVLSIYLLLSVFVSPKTLPVYNPADLNPEFVDAGIQHVDKNHTVRNFTLINQNGNTITQGDYEGKIYVVDFFFTRCPTICPIMANSMARLQKIFEVQDDVMFLSLSVTPEWDSVPVLKKYALRYGAMNGKWNITTGDKKHVYELARKSYFAVLDQDSKALQGFIHTPNFVLVDKKKQIRGIYEGTDNDEMERLVKDIGFLQSE